MFIRLADIFVYECSECSLLVADPLIERLADFASDHEALHQYAQHPVLKPARRSETRNYPHPCDKN